MLPSTAARRTITSMPSHARVWVYKSARALDPQQRELILDRGAAFTAGWAAHGAALDACVDILHDHFVVVAVDEQQALASGCSIDKSVRFVQDLEQELGSSLTDRVVVVYEGAQGLATCRVPEIEGLIKRNELTGDTLVYDDLVATKADLDQRFRVPLRTTWMSRYL